jgi:hypothetical protein
MTDQPQSRVRINLTGKRTAPKTPPATDQPPSRVRINLTGKRP